MRSFMMDQNQVERIDGMTAAYPYCMHQRDLSDFVVPWHCTRNWSWDTWSRGPA